MGDYFYVGFISAFDTGQLKVPGCWYTSMWNCRNVYYCVFYSKYIFAI